MLWEGIGVYKDDRNRPIPSVIQALKIPFDYFGVFGETSTSVCKGQGKAKRTNLAVLEFELPPQIYP